MKPFIQLHRLHRERSWWHAFSILALATAALAFMAACGNKGGGNATAPAPIYYGGGPGGIPGGPGGQCAACGGMVFLDSAIGETIYSGGPGAEIALEFFGQGMAGYGGAGGYFTQNQSGYQGPYSATGRLTVKVPMQACGIMPGVYTVQSVSPGTWAYKYTFWGGEMIAQGPTQLRLSLTGYVQASVPPARSAVDGRTFPYRINGRLQMYGPSFVIPCDDLVF